MCGGGGGGSPSRDRSAQRQRRADRKEKKRNRKKANRFENRRDKARGQARKTGRVADQYFRRNIDGKLNNDFWTRGDRIKTPSLVQARLTPKYNKLGRKSDRVMRRYYDLQSTEPNIPSNPTANQSFYRSIQDGIFDHQDRILDFGDRYRSDYNYFTDFADDLNNRATFLSEDASDYGIGDIETFDDQLTGLSREARSFNSPFDVGGKYGLGNYGRTFRSTMGGLSSRLNELQSQRRAEQDRVAGFETDLRNTADDLRGTIGDLDITDADQFDPLSNQIDSRLRRASRFDSELDFDFGNETSDLSGLSNQIDDLRRRRAQEEARVADATQGFNNQADRLTSLADNLGTRNLDRLNNARDSISEFRNTVGGFSSKLNPDFSGALASANDADAAIQGLFDTRQGELDTFGSNIADVRAGIADVPLYEEDEFADRRSQLRDIQADLNRYSGGRVEDIEGQVDTAVGDIDTRLQELADRRADIEQRAQAAYETLQDQSFTNLDALDDPFSQRETLQEEMDLYNAEQALDELNQMEELLNGERNRLQQDRENVLARQRIGREEIEGAMGPNGNLTFENFREIQPISQQEFARLVSDAEDEEEQGQDFATAFSRSLGLARR